MFRSKLTKGAIALIMAFLIGLFGAWVTPADHDAVTANAANSALAVQSAGNNTPADTISPNTATWVNCTPDNVAVFSNRIHIRCNESYSGIRYFAYPTSNAASSARFLSILTSAQVSGHTVQVRYDPADTSGVSYDCAASDCRPFDAVALY